MSTPILATKLYIPRPRAELVSRPRLIERLNQTLHCKFALISAPAGFGKTTLISAWLRQIDCPAAWLSLDENDNDPNLFIAYFAAPLQQVIPDIGQTVQDALHSPQPPSPEFLMTTLINEIVATNVEFIFVLDDYHVIRRHVPMDHALLMGGAQPHRQPVAQQQDITGR